MCICSHSVRWRVRWFLESRYKKLEKFLVSIFVQEPEDAYRRVRYFAAEQHEKCLKEYAQRYERTPQIIYKVKEYFK